MERENTKKILLCSPTYAPGTGEMHDYGQGERAIIAPEVGEHLFLSEMEL